jgi:eukaryotic-like serine/threonine-protein kinase
MTPEQWEKVKEVVEAGLEREGDERARFVDDACAADPSLRAEIRELIDSYEEAGSFMAAAVFDTATPFAAVDRDASLDGQRIGAYRMVRELGRGGMGTVYLAVRDDEAYRKEVAVKLITRGMDTESIVRAFRTERQILATLDHPNIARLLDGGTTEDGRLYFVMDYVEGLPLDVYCDAHTLPVLERLKLFRVVCSAVHDAHQHGVVHRDLKPGNILVTPGGIPKLLDFGIARVLNPEVSSLATGTTTTVRPLTPAYASPEQIRGEAITPLSDVYSLGVLLYELLTGHHPYRFQGHSAQELERLICEQEPERPSTIISRIEEPRDGVGGGTAITPASVAEARGDQPNELRHALAGDLDTIALMALRKVPEQRYASVDQLSEDLRRHLERLPILARKPTVLYRTTKLVGRNRATTFTAAISLVIILALVSVAFSSKTTKRARSLAVLPFQPLVGSERGEPLEFGIADALISQLNGRLTVRSPESVRKYAGRGDASRVAARELGVDALLVGHIGQAGDRIRLSVELIDARDNRVLWTDTFDEPWAQIFKVQRAIATQVARALAPSATTDERPPFARFDTENPAAYQEYLLGRHFWSRRTSAGMTAGLQHFVKAIELDPGYALAHAGIADSYVAFASFRVSSAGGAYVKAKAAAVTALALHPDLPEALSALAMVHLYHEWNWVAAERAFKRALTLNPDDGTTHMRYALALSYFDRVEEALGAITRAREADPLLAVISANVGKILYLARRYEEAIHAHHKALALDPNYWLTHHNLGMTHALTGAYDLAIVEFQRAIDLNDSSGPKAYLAYAYAVSGRSREAREILVDLHARAPQEYSSPFDIAVAYTGLGDRDRALSRLEKASHERVRLMPSLKVDPIFDPLHSDPRFAALIEGMGLFKAGQDGALTILPKPPQLSR